MDIAPMVVTGGWASGTNAYATVLILGGMGRLGIDSGTPPMLERTDVLIAAAILFAVEFVADKIPYLDSAWDAVHTVVRPLVGAWIGALYAAVGDADTAQQLAAALGGGGMAFGSHTVKAGFRMAVNTSPEPISNVATSLGEDGAVLVVLALTVEHPWLAAGIALFLLLLGAALLLFLATRIRRYLHRRRNPRKNPNPHNPPGCP
ncbi:DUF4126 domain-containing protein [Yinghuangia sp. YIM S09857]|uniref:DUF4126 domain-containing protein n=1 Tax=Yinghuangia sp. YIM S09857 TaxID=3436929 RepID=UPI003F52C701